MIQVRDWRPGLCPGTENAVLEPGVHDAARGGLGLGLYVCRQLLAVENGTITVLPADPDAQGCVVVSELPSAPDRTGSARYRSPALFFENASVMHRLVGERPA